MTKQDLHQRMIKSGFPRGFLSRYSLTDACEKVGSKISKSVLEWRDNLVCEGKNSEKPWLYLYGKVNKWKTALSCALAFDIIWERQHMKVSENGLVFYRDVSDLMDWMRDFRPGSDFNRPLWGAIKSSGLLLLDDFGTEASSEVVFRHMYQLLNYRYSQSPMITIITSNFEPSYLMDRIVKFGKGEAKNIEEFIAMADRIGRRIENQSILVEM